MNLTALLSPYYRPTLQVGQSLAATIDWLLPFVHHHSEDLREEHFYASQGGRPWLEVGDDLEKVVHYFKPERVYLRTTNGNGIAGEWHLLPEFNKIQIITGNKTMPVIEVYQLIFLCDEFFILKKDSYDFSGREGKYLVMGLEPAVFGLSWKEYCEALLYKHGRSLNIWAVLLWLLIGGLVLSVFL